MKHSQAFLKLVSAARTRVRETTVARVKAALRREHDMVLVDIREDREWDEAHIDGAIHIGRGILERDIEKAIPDKKKEIVLYCAGGFRSVLSAESLKKMGYRNVFSMKGGWRKWKKSGGQVIEGTPGSSSPR
jgi:rhodanese-related sulfurtransferase